VVGRGGSADTLNGRYAMGTIIPVQTFRKAIRTVKTADLGFNLKRLRLTPAEVEERKELATQVIRQLMAYRSQGTDDQVIMDNTIVSHSTFAPYLKEAASRNNLKVYFKHGEQLHKRTKAMQGTGKDITVISIA
jgi:hypothetical protein